MSKTLAQKLDTLIKTIRNEHGQQYTNEEIAKGCREITGESCSASYIWQLRTGKRDNPSKKNIDALAKFFDVPVIFFSMTRKV